MEKSKLILMMAVATFCIGLVPPYAKMGLAAPIILTVLRIFQGLSVGGEIPGAIAYVSESIPALTSMPPIFLTFLLH